MTKEMKFFYRNTENARESRSSCGSPLKLLVLLAFLVSPVIFAAGSTKYQAQEPLRQLAQKYLQQKLSVSNKADTEVSIGHLDPRLRLTHCGEKTSAFLPAGTKLRGKLTVGIRCEGHKPWTLYIPANIKVYTDVITASQAISRGTVVTKNDIVSVRKEVSNFYSRYLTNPSQVIGKISKKSLYEGDIFTNRGLKAPLLVHNGEEVTIIASVGNIQVRSKGKAMKDAAKGEKVKVRNIRSKRLIEAVVLRPGTVGVNM